MYTMKLNDGTTKGNLSLVNNCLISETEITPEELRGKLNPVEIEGTSGAGEDEDWGGITGWHAHMDVAYIKNTDDGKYALALYDIDPDQWEMDKLRADVDFALMLSRASF